MSKLIGRRTQIAIGREEAAYGTKSSQIVDIPVQEISVDLTKDVLLNDQAYARIEDNQIGSAIGKKTAEVTISGITSGELIGQFLKAAFGTLVTGAATPVAGAETHTFTAEQTNDADSYSIIYKDGNDAKQILGAVLSRLEINIVTGEWVNYSATFIGIFPADATETITPLTEELFTASHAVCKIATLVGGLAAASAVPLETGTIVIEKNTEAHFTWGSHDVSKVHNKQLSITADFELLYDDSSYFDDFDQHTVMAMSITLTTDAFITGTTPFSLAITIPTYQISEFSNPRPLDELVRQSFSIKAEYDTVTSKMADAVLVNTAGNTY